MKLINPRIFFLSLSMLVISAFAKGGNLAPCRSDSDCADNRRCRATEIDLSSAGNIFESVTSGVLQNLGDGEAAAFTSILNSLTKDCDDSSYCVCVTVDKDLIECSSDSDCSDNEECFTESCVDKTQASALKRVKTCSNDSECSDSNTTCVRFFTESVCLARFQKSTTSEQTDSGSSTSNGGNNDNNGSGDDSEVCIAVKSLRHLQPHQLVYQKHMTARVLCDGYGSCATAGHMVRYRGRAMMMKSYCELVGNCERSLTLVNSPRYTRALQIPSDSPDLTFTAFAARYATAAEEHVLRTAVHVGL